MPFLSSSRGPSRFVKNDRSSFVLAKMEVEDTENE